MISYQPCHCHSTFSSLDGASIPSELAERCVELGHTACAITDHGVVTGHFAFDRAMRKAGVKPIFGVEAYHVADVTKIERASEGDRRKGARKGMEYAHITLLARTQEGYSNLLQLVTKSYANFYYRPLLDANLLRQHQAGLTVLSGCVIGRLSQLINADREEDAFKWLQWYSQNLESFYVELVPCPGLDLSHRAIPMLYRMAKELKLPMVATDDSHFTRPEDYIVQDTLQCANTGQRLKDPDRKFKLPEIHYRCSGEEVLERLRAHLPEVPEPELVEIVERSALIAAEINVELPQASGPKFTVPEGMTAAEKLQREAIEGLTRRLEAMDDAVITSLSNGAVDNYWQRLERELETIISLGLAEYILVVWDLVREMRNRDILVVPRGSAGGSLLLWALNVTVVDPIKHNLPFERFCDANKRDLDVDLDFQHDRRHEAFEYLQSKYGAEHCAHVANVVTFGARSALIDAGKVLEIPEQIIAIAAALVPEAEDADAGLHDTGILTRLFETNETGQKLLKKCPELAIAARLEGQVRNASVHAGGFLVASRPIHEVTAIMQRPATKDVPRPPRVASLTKDEAAALGLLKIDCLGSKTLTAVAETVKEIGQTLEWLYQLPLEDPKVFEMMAKGHNQGLFQLQGNAAGRIMRELQPSTFDEIVAVSALARPGPLQSGAVKHFVARKHGTEETPELHPALAMALDRTRGIVLYQEQAMALAAAAGFPIEDVQKVRKLVSKIGGADAIEEYRERLAIGWYERGVPIPQIDEAYRQLKKAANYTFCEAHACQYAYTGAWTGYLKAYYPDIFTAALCRNVGNMDPDERQFALLREFVERGGKVTLLDPARSRGDFCAGKGEVVGGFQSLKKCGPVTTAKLLRTAPYASWEELLAALPKTVREPLAALGLSNGHLNADVLPSLAPWYPLVPLTPEEEAIRTQIGATPIRDTLAELQRQHRDEVILIGRITLRQAVDLVAQAKKYGRDLPAPGDPTVKVRLVLTDESGSADVAFSAKKWRENQNLGLLDGPGKGIGNTIAVRCWVSEDKRLYAQRAVCVRLWKPPVKGLTTEGQLDNTDREV